MRSVYRYFGLVCSFPMTYGPRISRLHSAHPPQVMIEQCRELDIAIARTRPSAEQLAALAAARAARDPRTFTRASTNASTSSAAGAGGIGGGGGGPAGAGLQQPGGTPGPLAMTQPYTPGAAVAGAPGANNNAAGNMFGMTGTAAAAAGAAMLEKFGKQVRAECPRACLACLLLPGWG